MVSNILLSICIPTYNRAEYLKQSLDILMLQLAGYVHNVEVIISDNCSTDCTKEVVEELSGRSPIPLSYSRNAENIGGNNNIALTVGHSSGKYVYVMGDDDILSPDFMHIIMPILQSSEELSIIHWNRLSGDKDCSNNIVIDNHYSTPYVRLTVSDFVRKILSQASLISSVIFNRQCWELGEPYVRNEYFGYNWYGRILWGANKYGKDCVYYYFPLIIQRNPSKSWIKFWPQYHISSMSNIFQDLDAHIPGIYGLWQSKLRRSASNALPLIMRDKAYYWKKDVREALSRHLTLAERMKMYFYLCLPFGYTAYRVKGKLISLLIKILESWK